MKKTLKIVAALILVALTGLLGACGKAPPAPVVKTVEVPTAEEQWLHAEKTLTGLATDYVRKHDIRNGKDCGVKTAELAGSYEMRQFPIAGDRAYQAACKAEIQAQARKRAEIYAKGRADERAKFAAKKAKAELLAKQKAAEAKRLAAKPVKPAVRSAAKVANQR